MSTEPTTTPGEQVRCGSCGEAPKAPPSADVAEPLTHCEWCGAEYPEPEPR